MIEKLGGVSDGLVCLEDFTVLVRNNLVALYKFHIKNLKEERKLTYMTKGSSSSNLFEQAEGAKALEERRTSSVRVSNEHSTSQR
jgi:hypothetical protein